MWKRLATIVLNFRLPLMILLLAVTAVMGYYASKVTLSYEFAKAIPTDNPKYQEYLSFKQKFGDDGNLLVIGVQTESMFQLPIFNAFSKLHNDLKKVDHVEDVISIVSAINLLKDTLTEKLTAKRVF